MRFLRFGRAGQNLAQIWPFLVPGRGRSRGPDLAAGWDSPT